MKTLLKMVLGLAVVAVVVVVGINIILSTPKKVVDTKWTDADFNSYMKKTRLYIKAAGTEGSAATSSPTPLNTGVTTVSNPASMEDMICSNFTSAGTKSFNDTVTSAELTALVNKVSRGNRIFDDFKVGFRDDGTMEVSGKLGAAVGNIANIVPEAKPYEFLIKQAVGKPIYWRMKVDRVSSNQFASQTLELYVGQVSVPMEQASPGLASLENTANDVVRKTTGFSCSDISISGSGIHFSGTIPEKLQYLNGKTILD
jgi:hypothetical protein